MIALLIINLLLQAPPVILWFIFHGQVVGEYKAMATATGHWFWAVPHLILLMLAVRSIYNVVYRIAREY